MKRLSIVIPVYNVERFIRKCLESVVNQGLSQDEYEIIVVNDGTPDRSMDVVADFVKSHGISNLIVIEQENKGLSAARNAGIAAASGRYVYFLDSDDWIEVGCLSSFLERAENDDLDVLCFDFNFVYPDGRKVKYKVAHEESGKIYKGADFISIVGMSSSVGAAIHRTQYLRDNDLHFYEGILYEDREFSPRAYSLAERISYITVPGYNYYCKRPDSITNANNFDKRSEGYLAVADSLYKFASEHFSDNETAFRKLQEFVIIAFTRSLVFNTGNIPYKVYKSKQYYPFDIRNIQNQRIVKKARLVNLSVRLFRISSKILHKP